MRPFHQNGRIFHARTESIRPERSKQAFANAYLPSRIALLRCTGKSVRSRKNRILKTGGLLEESGEFIPSPAPVWSGEADYELVPPSNHPPTPEEAGSYLKRSPISQAAIWRLPAGSNSPASSIPSTFETGGIRPVSGYSSGWHEEEELKSRNARQSNSKID